MVQAKQQDKSKNKYIAAGVVILILFIIAVVFLFRGCGNEAVDPSPTDGILYDKNVVEGGWDEADTEKIVDSLNEKVAEGMINISMNTSVYCTNGTSTGNLMIVNESINRYPQVVEITRNDTGEPIYKSGAIPVGSKIEKAKLDVDLDAGIYECTALFYNVNPETGDSLGCAGAIVTITILE